MNPSALSGMSAMTPPLLQVEVDRKSFGPKTVLDKIRMEMRPGEIVCLVGASGCGKSTLLRMIAGLDVNYDGNIYLEGNAVKGVTNQVGFIFQEPRLMPWLTVAENVAFNLDSPKAGAKQTSALLEEVGLRGTEQLLPKQLSGGMAQRVSIARGLFTQPKLLLLDEPFSAVDAFTRMKLQDLLLSVVKQHQNAVIMVTHDVDESLYVSDRVVVIGDKPGVIKDIIEVDLPRPRDRRDEELMALRVKVLNALHEIDVI